MPLVKNIHVKVPLVPLPTSFCLVSKRYVPTWLSSVLMIVGAEPQHVHVAVIIVQVSLRGYRSPGALPCADDVALPVSLAEPRAAPRWLIRRRGVARAKLAALLSGVGARHTVVDCDGPFWHRAARWLRMATRTAGRLQLRHAHGCVRSGAARGVRAHHPPFGRRPASVWWHRGIRSCL